MAKPQQRRRVHVVETVPLVEELLIQEDPEAAQQDRVHVGVNTAIFVENQDPEQIAVTVRARVALPEHLRVRFERRAADFSRGVIDAEREMWQERLQPLVGREVAVRPQRQRAGGAILGCEERFDRQRLLPAERPDGRPQSSRSFTPEHVEGDRLRRADVWQRATELQRLPPVVIQVVVSRRGNGDQ